MSVASNPKNNWLELLRTQPLWLVVSILIIIFVGINLIIAVAHYCFSTLDTVTPLRSAVKYDFFNYLYYTFVTSGTIGYGDLFPKDYIGKLITMIHTIILLFIFTATTSLLFLRLIYPRNTIILSSTVCHDILNNVFIVRLININKSYLVNPEIRIVVGCHCAADSRSNHFTVVTKNDICWLDNHDITLTFGNSTQQPGIDIATEIELARKYNKDNSSTGSKSRFRLEMSIKGSYGFQDYSVATVFKENQIITGNDFEAIRYFDKRGKHTTSYSNIDNFWRKFHNIV